MRKEAAGILVVVLLFTAAGCAPGDISQYTARVQQAGEAVFEGKAQQAAVMEDGIADSIAETGTADAEAGDTENENAENRAVGETAEEEEAGGTEEGDAAPADESSISPSGEEENVTTATGTDGLLAESMEAEESKSIFEIESGAFNIGGGAAAKEETAAFAEEDGKTEPLPEEAAAEETDGTGSSAEEAVKETAETLPSKEGTAKEEAVSGTPGAEERADLPEPAAKETARVQAAMEKKAAFFDGHLAGRDTLGAAEEEALQAVLSQEDYGNARLCLANQIQAGKEDGGIFLLLFERGALVNRGRVRGDLWFYAGEKAVRLLKDVQMGKLQRYEEDGQAFLLVQTERDGKTGAQVYRVRDGKAAGCFSGAADISVLEDGLCVTYRTDYVRYAPGSGWADQKGEQVCFYRWEESGFVQQRIKELTAEEYLSFIQPGEEEGEAVWKKQQEERFFPSPEDKGAHRYSFFAVGENRIGYRELRIGVPAEERGKSDTLMAEYSYEIYDLVNGRLTAQDSAYAGEGYYFADWAGRAEELEALFAVPVLYRNNRIGSASGTLQGKERAALERVMEAGGYGQESLCFVRQADYDGDQETESLIAAGHYDGIFGVPVCDLWLVKDGEALLLEETLPVQDVFSFQSRRASFFLLKGQEAAGAQDRLYGEADGVVCRLLPEAMRIEVTGDGDVTAWLGGADGEMPRYYRCADGEITEYETAEGNLQELLAYETCRAVYRHLMRSAKAGGALSCVRQDNGLVHVMYTDKSGTACYETYRIRERELVLVDCGEGSMGSAGQETAGE